MDFPTLRESSEHPWLGPTNVAPVFCVFRATGDLGTGLLSYQTPTILENVVDSVGGSIVSSPCILLVGLTWYPASSGFYFEQWVYMAFALGVIRSARKLCSLSRFMAGLNWRMARVSSLYVFFWVSSHKQQPSSLHCVAED